MKRLISFTLITVMMLGILTGCETALKQVEEHTFPDDEYAVNATDMAVVGDRIYYISGEKVYETVSDTVVFEKFPAEFISSNGTELAIYGNGQVWCGEKTYTIPQSEINSFVYADGTFCWSYQNDDLPQIGFYNIKSGETISVNPLTGVECKVMPYQGSKIIVLCYEISGSVQVYDYDTAIMKAGFINFGDAISTLAYRTEDNAILYADWGTPAKMYYVDLESNETQMFSTCTEYENDVAKMLISGKSAICLKKDGSIIIRSEYTAPLPENKIVTAVFTGTNNEDIQSLEYSRMLNVIEPVMEQYGIELRLINYTDEDKLKQKQLAGDDDYDIYVSDGHSLQLDYPIYEPLEAYPSIMEQFDLMFDEIRDICTHDGHIYGVVGSLNVNNNVLCCNDALFAELGLDIPEERWTYQDYYDLAVKAQEQGVMTSSYAVWWPADYIAKYGDLYETNSLMDDGSILREVLSINKKLNELRKDSKIDASRVLFPSGTLNGGSFAGSDDHYIMSPSFDGERHVISNASFLQMNVHSKNKDNAALVIAEFMKLDYGDKPGRGFFVFTETGEKLRKQGEQVSANVDLYLRVLQNYKPYYLHEEFLNFANEQYALYLDDKQDLEYTADQIYARAKMIFEE